MDKRQFQGFAAALRQHADWSFRNEDGRVLTRDEFLKELGSFDKQLAEKTAAYLSAGDEMRKHVDSRLNETQKEWK